MNASRDPIRVIQWGAGRNAQALIRAVARHADLQLVGCRIWSDSKNGVDAGVLAGIEPLGVLATDDVAALMALDADVVLHVPWLVPDMRPNDAEICDLLRSGKNVISLSGAHSMPAAIRGYGDQFAEACLAGNTTLAAGGINPGFIAERLATTLTGVCSDVDALRISETYDCSGGGQILFETMGFGTPLERWEADSPYGLMFHQMFVQVVHNIASSLGVELADVRRTTLVAAANRDLVRGGRLVEQGTVAAIDQTWEGIPSNAGDIQIVKQTRWVIARDIPEWEPTSGWRVDVYGRPNLRLDLREEPEGDHTYQPDAMVGGAIPLIPAVIAAKPGFLAPLIQAPFKKRFV